MPDVLRDWSTIELQNCLIFSTDRKKEARRQLAQLDEIGRQAAQLLKALRDLDPDTARAATNVVEWGLAGRTLEDQLNPEFRRDYVRFHVVATARYGLVQEWLAGFANEFAGKSRTGKRGASGKQTEHLMMLDLAAIFEWATGTEVRRWVRGKHHSEYGTEYAPFDDFIRAVSAAIFGTKDALRTRRWMDEVRRIAGAGRVKYSGVLTDIARRHPEWQLFAS